MDDRQEQPEHNGTDRSAMKTARLAGARSERCRRLVPFRLDTVFASWRTSAESKAAEPYRSRRQVVRGQCGKRFLNHFAAPWT
jgi:hypothetical protein